MYFLPSSSTTWQGSSVTRLIFPKVIKSKWINNLQRRGKNTFFYYRAEVLPVVWFLLRLYKRRAGLSAAQTSGVASSSWCCAASLANLLLMPLPGGSGRPAGMSPVTPRPSPCSWTWLQTHTQTRTQSIFILQLHSSAENEGLGGLRGIELVVQLDCLCFLLFRLYFSPAT